MARRTKRLGRRRRKPKQLELVIRKWGGARPGAGRPRTVRSRVPHRRRPRHASRHPVHITLRVRSDVPPLRRGKLRRVLAHVLWLVAEVARRRGRFRICHYSIQNDHIHLIVEAADTEALSRGMQGLAVRIAKRINHALGRKGTLWAHRYHAHPLKTPREVRNALVYVLQNGRKHPMGPGMGTVPATCFDAHSSAPWFDGWKERSIPRAPPEAEPPIAPPHTWLLREGWRRGGPISIHDSPAASRAPIP